MRGGSGGLSGLCECMACERVTELIHFSSTAPARGGDSGSNLKASAKCSLMNLFRNLLVWIHVGNKNFVYLDNSDHPPPTLTMTV